MKKIKATGEIAFMHYYETIYKTRWPFLYSALMEEGKKVGYTQNLLAEYFLDEASIHSALQFSPIEGAWLDMCAAPGGKTLVLSHYLSGESSLIANEIAQDRRFRLLRVLDTHVPSEIRSKIIVTGSNAAVMCKKVSNYYDRILLDAPCSSERHIIQSPKHLAMWKPSRTKTLHITQWALLHSAFLMLKAGGELVYSTCSISPLENDAVIEKLLKKYPNDFSIAPIKPFDGAFDTAYGMMILPDSSQGKGPLYIAKIIKNMHIHYAEAANG